MINTIKCIIATLNDVSVKGRDNMDKLLGCIMALETVVQMAEKHVEVKEEENGG